jgi:arylsulfatase A-like enzyme
MWLSFPEPHNPYQVPEPYFSMFQPDSLPPVSYGSEILETKGFKWEWARKLSNYVFEDLDKRIERARANYFGMLRLIDDQIKRLVSYLEDTGRIDNTLIIFMSDHGDFVGEYGLTRKGPEIPEIIIRIPMLFYGNKIKPHSLGEGIFASIVDIMPTICNLIGVPIPEGVQGSSLLYILKDEACSTEELRSAYAEQGFGGQHYDYSDRLNLDDCCIFYKDGTKTFDSLNYVSQSGAMRMVRKGKWKLVFDMDGNGQLYNIDMDKFEINNLFNNSDFKEIQLKMMNELLKWTIKVQDPLLLPPNSYKAKSYKK